MTRTTTPDGVDVILIREGYHHFPYQFFFATPKGGMLTDEFHAAMRERFAWCQEQFGGDGEANTRWFFRFNQDFGFADSADATAFRIRWC